MDRESSRHENEPEFSSSIQKCTKQISSPGSRADTLAGLESPKDVNIGDGANVSRNFDLNHGLEDGVDKTATTVREPPSTSSAGPSDAKGEEYPGWSLSEMDRMAIDPLQIAHLNSRLDEEEEDYDEEE